MKPYQTRIQIEEIVADERGSFRKPFGAFRSAAIVFPNTYHVGMSNLGLHVVYRLINQRTDFLCDRFFTDFSLTLENQRHLSEFELLFFTIPFEMDYPKIVDVLRAAHIPPLAADRTEHDPIIVVGGISVVVNPLPIADFADVIIPDEAECVLNEFLDLHVTSKSRREFFQALLETDRFILPASMNDETIGEKILRRRTVKDLTDTDAMTQIYTPRTEFSNMTLIEISRGCPYSCLFCFVGNAIAPYRVRKFDAVKAMIDKGREQSGAIGFISSAVGAHPDIKRICEYSRSKGMKVSFSSLRLEDVSETIIDTLAKSGQETLTIAPEAGTFRLRSSIAKPVRDDYIIDIISHSLSVGLRNIKLYFMIDLPEETAEDIEGITALVERIHREMKSHAKDTRMMGALSVNVGIFVPKPHTPFEQHVISNTQILKAKTRALSKTLRRIPNVKLSMTSPRNAQAQYTIAFGGRRTISL